MEVSMTDPRIEGGPGSSSLAAALGLGLGALLPGLGGHPPLPVPDADVGDIKMSVRTADHAEGSGQWFLCNGRAISRTTYSALFALVGGTYGPGDGLTTFNIPHYANDGAVVGRSPIGISAAVPLGWRVGNATHSHELNDFYYDFHVWNPDDDVLPFVSTYMHWGGAENVARDTHVHHVPDVFHTPPGGPSQPTDMATSLSPYLAVGIFMRVI